MLASFFIIVIIRIKERFRGLETNAEIFKLVNEDRKETISSGEMNLESGIIQRWRLTRLLAVKRRFDNAGNRMPYNRSERRCGAPDKGLRGTVDMGNRT